jgi:glycerol-3-phosphate O-acyltransferase
MLSDFATTRETAEQVARRTLRGRREADRLRRLGTRLGRIDLLFGSAISLARVTHRLLEERGEAPGWLARTVNTIARAVEEIAEAPESTDAARRARRLSLEAAEASRACALDADLLVALAAEEVHQIALDVLRSAGEETDPAASG